MKQTCSLGCQELTCRGRLTGARAVSPGSLGAESQSAGIQWVPAVFAGAHRSGPQRWFLLARGRLGTWLGTPLRHPANRLREERGHHGTERGPPSQKEGRSQGDVDPWREEGPCRAGC